MDKKKIPAKRVDIVSLKLVKESSILYETRKISNPYDAYKLVNNFLVESDREKFVVVCLDTKSQPVSIEVVSIGTVNSAMVHPREVFKVAILSNASKIICFHNHPSGNTNFSKEDEVITNRLQKCGEILGIELVDHIVVGDDDKYFSFKENFKM
ncbi:UNVERIFIED_CONTAM: DNA repair protein RadC [Clostridioides difficile]|uniref:JAB domain-containing protein n=1 Tax=Clostridioides difficile TaxID=1496 RepID=UPI00038D3CE4|nr:JAB domain-containing protein [Clostridioides difficile]EQE83450.1 radC-like JAB domain protein [Clostridioides difficile CD69]OYO89366.1 DNA repair protein RadC [Clostridioides difficile]HBE9726377.1 DNA repair protein RadC [Clostridioides difficile]HBF7936529.1 DNA repair protein RadC [Clostridioides difficile]HBG6489834.1 DNA repair protein RadC [Clostridioides difficile]